MIIYRQVSLHSKEGRSDEIFNLFWLPNYCIIDKIINNRTKIIWSLE